MLYNMLQLPVLEHSESKISNYIYQSEIELEKYDLNEYEVVVLDFPPQPHPEIDLPPQSQPKIGPPPQP